MNPEPSGADDKLLRLEELPREIGWLMVYVGVLGLVVPGIIGTPFLLAGAGVLVPGGRRRMARWVGPNPPRWVRSGLKQMGRFIDDVDRRYPRLPE